MSIDVTIRTAGFQNSGKRLQLWEAYLGDETLVKNTEPVHRTCRILQERGHKGVVRFFHEGRSEPAYIVRDLEKAALLSLSESPKVGLKVGAFYAHEDH